MKQLFSFLLIPHKPSCCGGICRIFDEIQLPIQGGTEKIKLIAFNCDKAEQIPTIIQGFLNRYKKSDPYSIETEAWSKFCLNQILKNHTKATISADILNQLSKELEFEINPKTLIYISTVENRWNLFKESIHKRLSTQL